MTLDLSPESLAFLKLVGELPDDAPAPVVTPAPVEPTPEVVVSVVTPAPVEPTPEPTETEAK